MKTTWGEQLKPKSILPEYPRPQMARESYLNLNGVWRYAITNGESAPESWDGDILVPFSPECELSGVKRALQPSQTLWYERAVTLPRGFCKGRVLLHFGAVDQQARVYVNGMQVCAHIGGYLPFCADVTAQLLPSGGWEKSPAVSFTLTVQVKDATDVSYHARGKQKRKKGGIWYTPQSGIWQTVWMESVPEAYIQALRITPCYDESAVEITVIANAQLPCTARVGDIVAQMRTNEPARISLLGFTPWSPEHPHLYDLKVQMGEDCVQSYFAMRKFSVQADETGTKRLFLNNKPYFHNGVLDQGYWPDGLYTAPSDAAMIHDVQCMKRLGFNTLRKHAKIEPLRWYYHCDRLGMLVWQDAVNGGGKYDLFTVTAPLFTGKSRRDDDYARFGRADAAGRSEYMRELEEMAALLYNCPCIALWTPF
ncbi:MAG: glycoside hydrolase family 2 TIM barrel-domain containing protein, partial [Eubacteriales bacterium]|nr:glycoside hydrolase family 2 TIM barrel-domain containing protein [Eubacteriales bacterium]